MKSFNFKKKFGQNFLQDENVILNIVNALDCNEKDLIIEIGPGSGALTKHLVKKAKVLCYEIDLDVKEYLDKLDNGNLFVIYDDFLNRNIIDDIKKYTYENLYIIGNLPYYITTPIITKIINENIIYKKMVFMVQKEVASRFASLPGNKEYGSISVFLNYFCDVKKLFVVNKNKFYPVPNVDSAVIAFTRKDNILNVDLEKFNIIVKQAFHMKRKNLRNNLKGYDLENIEKILIKNGYSLNNRAEDIPYDVYVDIANNC